jgi:Asp/Glu/hydantoin racemase
VILSRGEVKKEFRREETLVNKLNRSVIAGNHCNAAEVIQQSESSLMQTVLVGHNTGVVLTKENVDSYQHFIEDLLRGAKTKLHDSDIKLQVVSNDTPVLEIDGKMFLKKLEMLIANKPNNLTVRK